MAQTTILLREDVDNIGGRGEIVKVKAGYARNFLIPQGYAMLATKGNVKQIEQERAALLKKAAEEKSTAEAQLEQMQDISLTFERKMGETGQLFGSVSTMDIANALQAKGYEIDRRQIQLKEVIKETGEFTVPVKLHREVVLEVPVRVTDEEGNIFKDEEEESTQETAETAPAAEEETAAEPQAEENSDENAGE